MAACSPRSTGAPGTGDEVLDWSVTALRDTTDRLLQARSLDAPACYALISEAVWWSTMVDATMVRYHPDAYAATVARRDAAARRVLEDSFGGLRFVRNRMGIKADPEDFLEPGGPARRRHFQPGCQLPGRDRRRLEPGRA